MWFYGLPPPLPPDASLSDRFTRFTHGLARGLVERYEADRRSGVYILAVQLVNLIGTRLQNLRLRFIALAARAQAGPLPPPRPPGNRRREARKRQHPFPEPFAWLLKLGQWRVAPYKGDLEQLLADPGMQELIRTAPQVGRILRPFCRMLGVVPDPALLPPPPKRPARVKPPEPEPDPAAPVPQKPMRKRPVRTEPYKRKPKWTEPGTEWRKWRGIWMLEPIRKPTPS